MRFNINIHNRNHVLKNILGNLEHIITTVKLNKNELTVVNYHGTQKKFLANFETQLRYFKNRFHIISPEMLPVFFSGELKHIEKSLLLITFDDGIQNNLYAAEILNKHNIKAYFFIIPDFINFPSKNQNEYFFDCSF